MQSAQEPNHWRRKLGGMPEMVRSHLLPKKGRSMTGATFGLLLFVPGASLTKAYHRRTQGCDGRRMQRMTVRSFATRERGDPTAVRPACPGGHWTAKPAAHFFCYTCPTSPGGAAATGSVTARAGGALANREIANSLHSSCPVKTSSPSSGASRKHRTTRAPMV